MKTVYNFAHPLTNEAKAQLRNLIGEFEEHHCQARFNLDQPLLPQVHELCTKASLTANHAPDYIIPPFSAAAAYFTAIFYAVSDSDYVSPKPLIWLKPEPVKGGDPRWIIGGIEQ